MSKDTSARQAFDARLQALGLESLPASERDRLWQSQIKQREIAAGYDRAVAPAQEPAMAIFVPAPAGKDAP